MRNFIFLLFLFISVAANAQQPVNTSTFSGLPPAGTITGNELIPLDQNGVTKKATSSQLTLGSMVLGVASGGTGLSTVGPAGTVLTSNGTSLMYSSGGLGTSTPNEILFNNGGTSIGGYNIGLGLSTSAGNLFTIPYNSTNRQLIFNNGGDWGGLTVGSGLSIVGDTIVSTGGGTGTPCGSNGSLQFNNSGACGGYNIGAGLAVVSGALTATATGGGGGTPGGSFPQVQYNGGGSLAGLNLDTLASYAAHNTIANGISYDPRDAQLGSNPAICAGYNIFTSDGHTTTYNYTIPFTGSSATDNTNFMVFTEASNGTGSATILSSSDFSVTGVNTGIGGTITLNSAPANGQLILVVHDDANGFVNAATAATANNGYTMVPNTNGQACTIYGSQAAGTVLPEGAQLIGQSFTPNYGFQGQGPGPLINVIAPTNFEPAAGFNISNKSQQFYEGFEITSHVPGFNQLGFLKVPVLIGVVGSAGAGGGQVPGITAQYVTFNYGIVGFGSAIGGIANYIFTTLKFNNFVANTAGIYGPLSDQQIIGNDFTSNGAFGSIGSSGGYIVGPQQGAPGASSAGRIEYNRFEFNREGIVTQSATLLNLEGNQFDGNSACGLDLRGFWSQINITGGWFRGNGNGGGSFTGNTASGQDAHICAQSTSASSGGLYLSNVNLINNYSEGSTAPIGSPGATTPLYTLDMTTTGSFNNNIVFDGGAAPFGTGIASDASITDFAIYRNGRPTNMKVDTQGQAIQGKLANGNFSGQARGLPSNQWTALYVVGDANSYNNQITPLASGYGNIVASQMGTSPTYKILNSYSFFDCDVVDQEIVPNINTTSSTNALITWLPTAQEPTFGAGFYQDHLTDTNTCHLGGLTWATISRDYRVFGQSFTNTGTWTNDTHYTLPAGVTSNTNGDTSSGTITTYGGPIYLWFLMNSNNGGTFTYQLDSQPVSANVATQGRNAFTFRSGPGCTTTCYTLGAVRIPVASAGSHTVNIAITSTTSASNTVTIEGIGTPPEKPFSAKAPVVVLGGQIPNTTYTTASAAFNTSYRDQTLQLTNDGLMVPFADMQNYFNAATDYSGNNLNALGQLHTAQAFSGIIQPVRSADGSIDPRDYGASANSLYFSNSFCTHCNAVSTTNGSPVISVQNYFFQAGVATQTGGGDVGKRFCLGPGGGGSNHPDIGCSCIISVDTLNNRATLSQNALKTTSNHYGTMGGYPTNPADPTTCQDDTLATQTAGNAAILNGGKVFLPTNLYIHNLIMPGGILVYGNGPGDFYGEHNTFDVMSASDAPPTGTSTLPQMSIINCGMSGFPDDTQQCIQGVAHTRFSNFMLRAPIFPFTPFGVTAACLGYSTQFDDNANSQYLTDHLSFFGCPVDIGQAYGYNHDVGFTATISPNGDGVTSTMNVLSITTTNFSTYVNWMNGGTDLLALNRTITAPGGVLGASTATITAAAPGGLAGDYTINKSLTVSTTTSMTSPHNTGLISLRDDHSQHIVAGIGYNGDFTDSGINESICTGTFMRVCWYMGPRVSGTGNAANYWNSGRMEEMDTAGVICDGCSGNQFNNIQQQFNNIDYEFVNGSTGNTITGGMMQRPAVASVVLYDTSGNLDVTGVNVFHFSPGAKPLFLTATGSTSDNISVSGGRVSSNLTAITDFTNHVPTHYKQSTSGWPYIDTTQSILSATSTGGVAIGKQIATNGTALDLFSNTTTANSSLGVPKGTTANRPITPVAGMVRYNTDLVQFEGYNGSWGSLGGGGPVTVKTANYSILASDSGTTFTNTGAAGAVTLTLPTAAGALNYCFFVDTAQNLVVASDSGHTIRNGLSLTTTGGNLTASAIGNQICVRGLNTTEWYVYSGPTGQWTVN